MARTVSLEFALPMTQPLSVDCDSENVFKALDSLTWDMTEFPVCCLSPSSLTGGTPASSPVSIQQGPSSRDDWDVFSQDKELMRHCFASLGFGLDLRDNDCEAEAVVSLESTQIATREEEPCLHNKQREQTSLSATNVKKRPRNTTLAGDTKHRRISQKSKNSRKLNVTSQPRNQLLSGKDLMSGCHLTEMEQFLRL